MVLGSLCRITYRGDDNYTGSGSLSNQTQSSLCFSPCFSHLIGFTLGVGRPHFGQDITTNVWARIEFNDYNAALFNIRTRSLNNLVYWMAQIFGAMTLGLLLDHKAVSRRFRAFSGWTLLIGMVFIVHIWGYFYQRQDYIILLNPSLSEVYSSGNTPEPR